MTAGPHDPDPDAQWQVRLPPSDPLAADHYLPPPGEQWQDPPPGQQRQDPPPGQQRQDPPTDQQARTWQQPGQQWQDAPPDEQARTWQQPGQQWQDPPLDQQARTWQQPRQQWQGGYDAQYQMRPVVAPRSPALGVLLSFFIPGLGSMVNGRPAKGILILITYVIGWVLTLVLIGVPILFGAWIWGMVDGYKAAQAWNRSHGIIS